MREKMMLTRVLQWVIVACCISIAGGCASLPDTQFLSRSYTTEDAKFENARGQLSAKRSAAILAELKRKSGDLDILDKQIILEQQIVGNPLMVGNKVTLLQDGPATYNAMFDAIRHAKDNIDIESYIIEDGKVGQQFADLLLERQMHGVQVNLIYDSFGAFGTSRAFFDKLAQAGIAVLEFNPVNPLTSRKSWDPNHRDHRKLLVVDGRIAFIGGINISSVYSSGSSLWGGREESDPKAGGWRDTDIQIEGPVVAEFQKLFIATWTSQHAKPMADRDYFPTLKPQGKEIMRAIGSTPDDPYNLIYLTLISAITNAEKEVHITNAYFVPDPQLMQALLAAAKRGVDVRLILPPKSDALSAVYAGRSHYEELLRGGVKIYERRGAVLHTKSALIDGVWTCVGSSNLDWRSALDNDEIVAVILGREFAQQMEAAFNSDMAASDQIMLADWEHRSLLERLRELKGRLLGRLL